MKNLQHISIALIILILSACSGSTTEVSTGNDFIRVDFPDGSVAYLNKNSSISYKNDFTPRQVEQSGEVFYKVMPGTNPFTVKTEHGEVKVLGTEFNVKDTQEAIEVEVEKGKVELFANDMVESIGKGQKAVCKHADKQIRKMKAELKHSDWINDMKAEFKKLGKDWDKNMDEVQKQSEKTGKEIKKGFEKLKDKIKD